MIITQAPAKVNLRLQISGLRPDGYHEVETLMVPLELSDEIRVVVSKRKGIQLECSGLSQGVPDDRSNLVYRAAEVFLNAAKPGDGIKIRLEKRIPNQSGLGGGSSDAASTLLAMNQLFENPLDRDQLHELAAGIGSDVPFFLYQSSAICRGRGEQVEPVPLDKGGFELLLVKPPFGVSTSWAYSQYRKFRDGNPAGLTSNTGRELFNALEEPVFQKYLLLPVLKNWLLAKNDVRDALLSGSGSTIFAILHDRNWGEDLCRQVREEFGGEFWTCVTRTVSETAKY